MNATVFFPFMSYFVFLIPLLIASMALIFIGRGPLRIIGYILLVISILWIVYIVFVWITLSNFTVPYNGTTTFLNILISKGMKL